MKLDYPRDLKGNLVFRTKILQLCESEPKWQAYWNEYFKRDICAWIDLTCWATNPRLIQQSMNGKNKKSARHPFILYDYQRDHIREIQRRIMAGEDIPNEKTRDSGASWIYTYIGTWFWRYVEGADSVWGSWREDYVDELENIQSLFEKIRFNIRRQPLWWLPQGFNVAKHMPFCLIKNPENGNSMTGEAPNEKFGSGGRTLFAVMDEISKWDRKKGIGAYSATSDVTSCKITIWTPYGLGNQAHELSKNRTNLIIWDWRCDPRKIEGAYYIDPNGASHPIEDPLEDYKMLRIYEDLKQKGQDRPPAWMGLKGCAVRSKWYDGECVNRSEQDIAENLDREYAGSGSPRFDLQALSKQSAWKEFIRKTPSDPKPDNMHVRGVLKEISHKLTFYDVPKIGWLRIYQYPIEHITYAIGCDTSEGLEKGDQSSIIVRDKYTRNVVATVIGKYATEDLEEMITLVAKFYNDANTAIERNNTTGGAVITGVSRHPRGCNLYKERDIKGNPTERIGFNTTSRTRPVIITRLTEEVRLFTVELRDKDLIDQCRSFVRTEKKYEGEAAASYFDDAVMGCCISGQVIDDIPYKYESGYDNELNQLASLAKQNSFSGY